jgi:hypothetical protein
VEKILAKIIEGFMVRHKSTGEFLHEGLRARSKSGGKIWRSAGRLNSAMRWHTKDVNDRRCLDLIKNPQDYEVVVLRIVDSLEMTEWF